MYIVFPDQPVQQTDNKVQAIIQKSKDIQMVVEGMTLVDSADHSPVHSIDDLSDGDLPPDTQEYYQGEIIDAGYGRLIDSSYDQNYVKDIVTFQTGI